MTPRAYELATTILQMCESSPYKTLDHGLQLEHIVEEIGSENKYDIESVINNFLIPLTYIKKISGAPGYMMTPLGRNYLQKQGAHPTINVGSNVNFAYHSPGAMQTININELAIELQEKVHEFDQAVKIKDASTLKQAFTYIADKSVDVAIALATGALMR